MRLAPRGGVSYTSAPGISYCNSRHARPTCPWQRALRSLSRQLLPLLRWRLCPATLGASHQGAACPAIVPSASAHWPLQRHQRLHPGSPHVTKPSDSTERLNRATQLSDSTERLLGQPGWASLAMLQVMLQTAPHHCAYAHCTLTRWPARLSLSGLCCDYAQYCTAPLCVCPLYTTVGVTHPSDSTERLNWATQPNDPLASPAEPTVVRHMSAQRNRATQPSIATEWPNWQLLQSRHARPTFLGGVPCVRFLGNSCRSWGDGFALPRYAPCTTGRRALR